jgi:hypothetical protein
MPRSSASRTRTASQVRLDGRGCNRIAALNRCFRRLAVILVANKCDLEYERTVNTFGASSRIE